MPDTPEITTSTPTLTHDDPEVLPPSPPGELPRHILSRLVSVVRWYPLLSATILHVSFAGMIVGLAKRSYNWDVRPAYNQIPQNRDGVALIGHGYRVDMISQSLSIKWELEGCGAYKLSTYPPASGILLAAGCDVVDRAVDIYLNGASMPTFSYDPANLPLIQPGYPWSENYERVYVNTLNTFSVDQSIDIVVLDRIPFDTYTLSALVFVIETATNKSVPIITFAAGEGPDNYSISSFDMETRSNYTYDSGTGPTTVEVDSRVIQIKVKRSQLAHAFTVCLLLIGEGLAIGSTYVTFLVIFGRERVDVAVLLLPVATILTIPSLRSLYPGSPPFGVYVDTFGLFFQMMTVAACSMILLCKIAIPPAQDRRAFRDVVNAYIRKIQNMLFP